MKQGSETEDAVSFIKNNYYSGKLLRASDFIREQEYVNKKLAFINRSFHGRGIIEGLDVRMKEDGTLHISEGSALDSYGRILIVPEETTINVSKLEGLPEMSGHDFILGIQYAERTTEEEISYLEPEKPYRGAKIEESFVLKAYTREDWKNLKASEDESIKTLTEETVLFQDGNVGIVLLTPKAVPADSVFRCRIQARVLHGDSVGIRWQCTASLQGAFFAESGQAAQILKGEGTVFSGSVMREWEICTEENRKYPITLELTQFEIISGNFGKRELETCRVGIGTAPSYEDIVKKYLWQEPRTPGQEAGWLPLAYIKASGEKKGEQKEERVVFEVSKEQDVRLRAFRPVWERLYRQEAESNGIVDIRWRGLLKVLWQTKPPTWFPEPLPKPYGPQPQPCEPFPSQPQQELLTQQVRELVQEQLPKQIQSQVQELVREQIEEKREMYIRRGVTVIPVPRHYRKGRTLLSEEIAHGFPGEEVFLWCGRVFEEKNYAYWSRDKMRYSVLCGDEELFSNPDDSGWTINKRAIRQNVEDGTFQVALTLSGSRRRNRSREVAILWIAVKTIQAGKRI